MPVWPQISKSRSYPINQETFMFDSINSNVTTVTGLAVDYHKDYNFYNPYIPLYGCSVQAVYADATPTAQTFVAADVNPDPDNSITIVAHGFFTGLSVALTGTNLPTGLSATTYYIVRVDADTIQLATSLANAIAGTVVTISDQGTTTDAALTPDALAGVVIKLQASNDGTHFTDVAGKTVTVGASGSILWDLGVVTYRVLRVSEAASTGAIDLILNFNAINLL
jgi:hypothetical protein